MKIIKKILKTIAIIIVLFIVAIVALIIYDTKKYPALSEEQVKESILEQIQPQLEMLAEKNGFDNLGVDIKFEEFEFFNASFIEDGVINISLKECYTGGPFNELDEEIFNDDTYNRFADIERINYEEVKIDNYRLYINPTSGLSFIDGDGDEFYLSMGMFIKNGETVAIVGNLPELLNYTEIYGKYSGASGSKEDKENSYDDPMQGESFSDYVKRVDPELYKEMTKIYNEAVGK